jgi:hypothetical protein
MLSPLKALNNQPEDFKKFMFAVKTVAIFLDAVPCSLLEL